MNLKICFWSAAAAYKAADMIFDVMAGQPSKANWAAFLTVTFSAFAVLSLKERNNSSKIHSPVFDQSQCTTDTHESPRTESRSQGRSQDAIILPNGTELPYEFR